MTDAPPPYPGIGGAAPYPNLAASNPTTHGAWSAPQGAGAMSASAPYTNGTSCAADAKASEAAASGIVQTGYYDPTNPQTAYIPPGTVCKIYCDIHPKFIGYSFITLIIQLIAYYVPVTHLGFNFFVGRVATKLRRVHEKGQLMHVK